MLFKLHPWYFQTISMSSNTVFKKCLSSNKIHSDEAHYHDKAFHVSALQEIAVSSIQRNRINITSIGEGEPVSKIFCFHFVGFLFDIQVLFFFLFPVSQYPLLCHLKFPVQQSTCLFTKTPQGMTLIFFFL